MTEAVIAPAGRARVARRRPRLSTRLWLAIILGVATLGRVLWVLHAAGPPRSLNDLYWYTVLGRQIAAGNGYVLLTGEATAYYPVGYPAALGGVLWLMHHTPLPDSEARVIGFFQVILGVATVALVFEVARRLWDATTGLVAAAIVAVWPNLVFHTAVALSETLFNFLLLCTLLVVVWRPWPRPFTNAQLWLFGALVGVSALVRPIALLLLPVLLFTRLRAGNGWRASLRQLLVITIAAAVVIAPWAVRNTVRLSSPVLIATHLGDDLCMSRHPGATGGFDEDKYCSGGFDPNDRPAYEIREDRYATRRALAYLVDHPLSEPRLLLWRAYFTLYHDHDGLRASESYGHRLFLGADKRAVLGTVADFFFYAALGLGLLGLRRVGAQQDPRRLFVMVAMAALAAPPLLFFGDARFHVPALPLLAMPVALALLAVFRRPRDEQLEREPA